MVKEHKHTNIKTKGGEAEEKRKEERSSGKQKEREKRKEDKSYNIEQSQDIESKDGNKNNHRQLTVFIGTILHLDKTSMDKRGWFISFCVYVCLFYLILFIIY